MVFDSRFCVDLDIDINDAIELVNENSERIKNLIKGLIDANEILSSKREQNKEMRELKTANAALEVRIESLKRDLSIRTPIANLRATQRKLEEVEARLLMEKAKNKALSENKRADIEAKERKRIINLLMNLHEASGKQNNTYLFAINQINRA